MMYHKKHIISIIVFLVISLIVHAQQDPKFTQYMHNQLLTNPAFAGSKSVLNASIIHRHQWWGFGGDPVTTSLSVDLPVSFLHGGIGVSLVQDIIGFDTKNGGLLSYAYRFNAGAGALSVGPQLGFYQKALDGSSFNPADQSDAAIPLGAFQKATVPDVGIGVYYNTNKLYFGFSMSHLLQNKVTYTTLVSEKLARHYYIISGYDYVLNPKISFIPSMLVKTEGASTQLDLTGLTSYKIKKNKLWGGINYSSGDLIRAGSFIGALVGFNLTEMLNFGYAYDFNVTTMRTQGKQLIGSIQTHEIAIIYQMPLSPPVKPVDKIRTPRFL